ncbi:MAG: class I SAM-dependent methyltransferase [Planctomycetes bacterium]|nr:class I SAM-dependent methyltransferase [Planctomycetota bacterium]
MSQSKSNGHERILELLRALPPSRVLDIPSGGGPVVDGARAMGHDVIEVDLFPRKGIRGVLADACAPLPFQDASFDVVVTMEGIEHFENQTGFLRECARVLKPGGKLILTTPNMLHLSSRISGFWTGQRLLKHGFINEVSTLNARMEKRLYHGHAYLIDVFRLRYILRVIGMKLESVDSTTKSGSSLAMAPLVPVFWAVTRWSILASRKHLPRVRQKTPPPEVEDELARVAMSPAVLFGKKLIVVARREGVMAPLGAPARAPGNATAS